MPTIGFLSRDLCLSLDPVRSSGKLLLDASGVPALFWRLSIADGSSFHNMCSQRRWPVPYFSDPQLLNLVGPP